jgi:tetratricopeptide (TPR) repeat protein
MRDDLAERLFALLPPELPESLLGRPEGCLASARAVKAFRAFNLSEALRLAHVALAAQRAAGALRDVADTLGLTGYILHELGVYEQAEACLREQVQLGQRIGSTRDVSYGELNIGSLYLRQGRLDDAERALEAALHGYLAVGITSCQGEALGHLAGLWCARGDLARALGAVERALAIESLEPAPKAYVLARAANLALLRGKPEEALGRAVCARELMESQGVSEFVGLVQLSYIDSLLAMNEQRSAHEAVHEAQRWLVARSLSIDDAALRQSFLLSVPEHARICQLASDTVLLGRER